MTVLELEKLRVRVSIRIDRISRNFLHNTRGTKGKLSIEIRLPSNQAFSTLQRNFLFKNIKAYYRYEVKKIDIQILEALRD